mmetsp:Transcript_27183/g.78112  ORF Transcript_27183/g.78112 Transcript_27183/m.78112 type:complete len:205 (-) Transcript_27183:31-645(-)
MVLGRHPVVVVVIVLKPVGGGRHGGSGRRASASASCGGRHVAEELGADCHGHRGGGAALRERRCVVEARATHEVLALLSVPAFVAVLGAKPRTHLRDLRRERWVRMSSGRERGLDLFEAALELRRGAGVRGLELLRAARHVLDLPLRTPGRERAQLRDTGLGAAEVRDRHPVDAAEAQEAEQDGELHCSDAHAPGAPGAGGDAW